MPAFGFAFSLPSRLLSWLAPSSSSTDPPSSAPNVSRSASPNLSASASTTTQMVKAKKPNPRNGNENARTRKRRLQRQQQKKRKQEEEAQRQTKPASADGKGVEVVIHRQQPRPVEQVDLPSGGAALPEGSTPAHGAPRPKASKGRPREKKKGAGRQKVEHTSNDPEVLVPPTSIKGEAALSPPGAPPTPKKRKRPATQSPYFPPSPRSPKQGRVPSKIPKSAIPFPPTSSPRFGLIQEKLSHDPFKLMIAVTFLNRTRGTQAIPIFYELMRLYPIPAALASADQADVADLIRTLGLQNTRAKRYIDLAKAWVEDPPIVGRRHRKLHYPCKGDGSDLKKSDILPDERDDARFGAWEIAHIPTSGPYCIDSWRIFCRDTLRGLSTGWNGEGNEDDGFEPEWKRVVPLDKELRAFLRWMWLREGVDWDPLTGDGREASAELMARAEEGGIVWENGGDVDLKDEMEAAPGEDDMEPVDTEERHDMVLG